MSTSNYLPNPHIQGPKSSPHFTLSHNRSFESTNSNEVVNLVKSIRKEAEQNKFFKEKYRLELLFSDNGFTLTVSVDPIVWYDQYTYLFPDEIMQSSKFEIAKNYVDEVCGENWKEYSDSDDIDFDITREFKDPCRRWLSTKQKCSAPCDYAHPTHLEPEDVCGYSYKLFDYSTKTCRFYPIQDIYISIWSTETFHVITRRELSRELLLLPGTPPRFNMKKHYTNSTLSEFSGFWDYLKQLKFVRKLPINRVALNFGRWESGLAREPYRDTRECHGHAHLYFDGEKGWNDMMKVVETVEGPAEYQDEDGFVPVVNAKKKKHQAKKQEDISKIRKMLQAFTKPPVNYELKNAVKLKRKRLTMDVVEIVQGDISDIKGEISDIKDEISNMKGEISDIKGEISNMKGEISNELSNIKGDISNMKGDISNINKGMNTLQNLMEKLIAQR